MNNQNTEYSKKWTFGKVAYNGKSKSNLVELEATLTIEDGLLVFSASGQIWNNRHTDIIMGGQCIEDIYNEFKREILDRKRFEAIMGLWERNHLNDMQAGCFHQRAEKWGEKKLSLTKLKLKWQGVAEKQGEIEKKAQARLEAGEQVQYTAEELALVQLPYWVTVPSEKIAEYPLYEIESQEEKTSGWVYESDHPEGVLSKACKKCGYKYGTGWVYAPIAAQDVKELFNLFDIHITEQLAIIRAYERALKTSDKVK